MAGGLPREWRCTHCRTWNRWFKRNCRRCLSAKPLQTLPPGDVR